MRSITKGPEPRDLIQWKSDNAQTPQNLKYGAGGFPAEAVRAALLSEQYHLCACTMKGLPSVAACAALGLDLRNSCHIEHILPQCRGVAGEDIDYHNMVACHPPSNSKIACGYGAKFKDQFDPGSKGNADLQGGIFVSPLSPNVEKHFEFDEQGEVAGLTANGTFTIAVLKLNHAELKNDRAAIIKGLLRPRGKPLSAASARRLAMQVMRPDGQGGLTPFCVAVASVALSFATREERRAKRLRRKADGR